MGPTANPTNPGLRKSIKSAVERLSDLEAKFDGFEKDVIPRVIAGVNGGFSSMDAQLTALMETVNALAQCVGEESVASRITENRIKRAESVAKAQEASIAEALKAGRLKVAEAIGEKSTIIGKEYTKEGELKPPGRVQMDFSMVRSEFRDKLKGMKVGESIETPEGGRVDLTEVYDLQDLPPQAAAPSPEAGQQPQESEASQEVTDAAATPETTPEATPEPEPAEAQG